MVEQRGSPRIEKALSMTLRGDAFRLVTETKNISITGAYCQVSQPIPTFAKVSITLSVPVMGQERKAPQEIRCEGVVVRSEKTVRENGNPEKYFVAIYFTRLNVQDREILNQYVTYHLTHYHA
ncbi:MAG: PilZ domain-containing protein [Candidatus Omnitrophica bacterium]|nr:PilZ domain-containing protein [Candidatus Omnitrophota bacterium]